MRVKVNSVDCDKCRQDDRGRQQHPRGNGRDEPRVRQDVFEQATAEDVAGRAEPLARAGGLGGMAWSARVVTHGQ